jgi:hypothetical protein
MPLVSWVGKHLAQVLIPPHTAAILGWAGALAGETDRVTHTRLSGERLLNSNVMFPAIAEVVGVANPLSLLLEQPAECRLALARCPSSGSASPYSL